MDKLSQSLNDTLLSGSTDKATKELSKLGEDLAELTIDSLINNVLIQQLPIVKTISAGLETIKGVSNYILLQKIIRFLFALKDTDEREREKFLSTLEGKEKNEIITNLMVILDKHDNLSKSEYQGKLFSSFIKGVINYQEYMSITHAINQLEIGTVPDLINLYTDQDAQSRVSQDIIYGFIILKLMSIDTSLIGKYGGSARYYVNPLGVKFTEICLDKKVPETIKNYANAARRMR